MKKGFPPKGKARPGLARPRRPGNPLDKPRKRWSPLLSLALAAVALAASAAPSEALAETKRVCWVNATKNTDNTDIPATGPGSLDRTYVQYGTRDGTGFGTLQGRVSVAAPDNCLDLHLVVVQEFALRAFHCNTFHTETTTADVGIPGCSDFSNVALTEVQPPRPLPPTELATSSPTAYIIRQSADRVALLPVGTVPLGTQCDTSQPVMGLYVVPKSALVRDPSVTVEPEVVLAQCG